MRLLARFLSPLASSILTIAGACCLSAQTVQTVTFETQFTTPTSFSGVVPGGRLGPVYVVSGVSFDGGVLLNEAAFGNAATTKLFLANDDFIANMYGTGDRVPLQDGSVLPGSITATFASPQNFLRLDIANGGPAASFTLTALDAAGAAVASSSVALTSASTTGATGSLFISASNIRSFTLTSSQPKGQIGFAIDTLTFMASAALSSPPLLVADSIANYSGVQGRNGWSYGFFGAPPSTTFTPFSLFRQGCGNGEFYLNGFVWCSSEREYLGLWQSGGHPTDSLAVRRWRSPVAGSLLVIGKLAKSNVGGGNGVLGRISINGNQVFSRAVGGTDSNGVDYSVVINVSIGSDVDFVLDGLGDGRSDWATFSAVILALPGPPSALKLISGNNQTVTSGTVAAAPVVVQVTDSAGLPVQGVMVGFSPNNATVSQQSLRTDADGRASVQVTAGPAVGPATVVASVQGLPSVSFTFAVQAPPSLPVISKVVNGASFLTGFASGAWVTIEGENLSPSTRTWSGSDFVNGALPSRLDGVSVTINGKSAFVYFVSPKQLNVLSPDDPANGSVPVVVTTPSGVSRAFSALKSAVAPGLFLFTGRYPAAVHASGVYVGPVGLIPGAAFLPAAPRETILVFGSGFGPTTPPWPSGMVFSGGLELTSPVRATIGGQPAPISFAGAIGPGLYQFNITIPDLPDGEAVLVLEVNGVPVQSGLVITIKGQ